MCSCACSQAKYRMSCMANIWWWFTRLNFWMKFMSLREILVMFVCDMPMFVGQTFVGEISYIYIYMWGWVKTYHYHGRVSTSWTFMNQLCKGSRVPRFWPIASHNNTRPSTAGRTLGCRSGTASGDGIRFALLWGGTGRFPRHGTLLMCGRLESGWEGWWFMAMDMICYIYIYI